MILSELEQAMLGGEQGPAVARAMELLVEYGDVLGAPRLVETDNVCGANIFGPRHSNVLKTDDPERLFGRFSLATDEPMTIPQFAAHSCQLIGPRDPQNWEVQNLTPSANASIDSSEKFLASHGVSLLNTCTPYQVGNNPRLGEHCAWMESSAVIYVNSVLGARTNVEGRESAAAAMITGRIPYWGFHTDEHRLATHVIEIARPVRTTYDWNVLGYFVGDVAGDDVVVLDGAGLTPDPVDLKQFGAAAASSGDLEMYHIPGITAEARTLAEALGNRQPLRHSVFDKFAFDRTVDSLNVTAREADNAVDFVMIGCPHASLNQIRDVARLLEGQTIAASTSLWLFTPRSLREVAQRSGWVDIIERAGGKVMADTCPAIAQFLPKGTRSFATDSAKQVHYLPAIMGIAGRFGSTEDCVRAAVTGRWAR